jgi:hypothetical protein
MILVVICLFFSSGCASQESRDAYENVKQVQAEIEADGVVTPEEQARYVQAVQTWAEEAKIDMEQTDWAKILGGVAASVLLSFTGVNFTRNRRERKVWGTPEAPKA